MTVEFRELTFPGRGAISVVGVRGEQADRCIGSCFQPINGRPYVELSDRPIVYGTWVTTNEDLIVVRKDNHSFEIQCHGSLAAVQSIKEDLWIFDAVESDEPLSWTFSNQSHQAEVSIALEAGKTQRCAKHLLQQFHLWEDPGVLDTDSIEQAQSYTKFGLRLSGHWTIVLCGRPNVGKSSLINAIAGFDRAIVHETAGTTRDLVSQQTAIDGWPVELIDSAGIRETDNDIEQAGISRARNVIESADLVIHIVDATSDMPFDPAISQHRAGLVVVNKIDLCEKHQNPDATCPVVSISAKTGQGINEFLQAVSETLVPDVPGPNQLIPVTESQIAFLRNASR
jgi:tRNA modification GTPase